MGRRLAVLFLALGALALVSAGAVTANKPAHAIDHSKSYKSPFVSLSSNGTWITKWDRPWAGFDAEYYGSAPDPYALCHKRSGCYISQSPFALVMRCLSYSGDSLLLDSQNPFLGGNVSWLYWDTLPVKYGTAYCLTDAAADRIVAWVMEWGGPLGLDPVSNVVTIAVLP